MRIIFAGTPEFAATALEALFKANHTIVGVYTQPDRPHGRHQQLTPSPVKQSAQAHSTPVFQPKSLKSAEAQAELAELKPDLMVVAAYGLLLPKAVLTTPTYGCINIHASLLPRWRGASPITQAILMGDEKTGIRLMQMDEGLDTGPVITQSVLTLNQTETTGQLTEQLALLGAELLLTTLKAWPDIQSKTQPQSPTGMTHAPKIKKEEANIDWNQTAQSIERKLRAFDPWPGCHSYLNQTRIQVWKAQVTDIPSTTLPGTLQQVDSKNVLVSCKDKCLRVQEAQLAGKKRVGIQEILRGYPNLFVEGQCFITAP